MVFECSVCFREFSSCKGLESHWSEVHAERLRRRQRSSSKAGRGLMVTNLVEKWRRVVSDNEVSI